MSSIKSIHFGLKLWARNHAYVDEAAELIRHGVFDYLEIMPEAGYDVSVYPRDIRYVVHAFKFNPADVSSREYNRSMMRLAIDWANALGSDTIILHPGIGTFKDSKEFVDDAEWRADKRIIIENMPCMIYGERGVLGSSPAEIKAYGRPICLDIGHMMSASATYGVDYRRLLDEFLELKPAMAHIMDGHSAMEEDEHLGIGDGDYDMKYIVNRLAEAGIRYATLETPGFIPEDSAAQMARLERIIRI
jgi:sugar phosphate isomerase/epimerase